MEFDRGVSVEPAHGVMVTENRDYIAGLPNGTAYFQSFYVIGGGLRVLVETHVFYDIVRTSRSVIYGVSDRDNYALYLPYSFRGRACDYSFVSIAAYAAKEALMAGAWWEFVVENKIGG